MKSPLGASLVCPVSGGGIIGGVAPARVAERQIAQPARLPRQARRNKKHRCITRKTYQSARNAAAVRLLFLVGKLLWRNYSRITVRTAGGAEFAGRWNPNTQRRG